MEKEITLTQDTFKALAGEKRIQILKELGQRRKTQSELAQKLGLSAPTIAEHLDLLEKAGLVHGIDEGRKWKYFALTEKGKEILHPGESKILVLLGTSLIAFLGGIGLLLYRYGLLGNSGAFSASRSAVDTGIAPAVAPLANGATNGVAAAIQETNQKTIQEGIVQAIQNAFQQTATKATEGAASPVLDQGIQDLNSTTARETINQVANQASQEILPKLVANAPAPVTLTQTVPIIGIPELALIIGIALAFGLVLGYYWHYKHQPIGKP